MILKKIRFRDNDLHTKTAYKLRPWTMALPWAPKVKEAPQPAYQTSTECSIREIFIGPSIGQNGWFWSVIQLFNFKKWVILPKMDDIWSW